MYKGFNLRFSDSSYYAGELLRNYGAQADAYRIRKANARRSIADYLRNGGIDAQKLQDDWFQSVGAHVFISHSHADEDLAMAIAAALEDKLGLRSFIDSSVWGNADELLKEIDNEYCMRPSGDMYDYDKRNRSTSHVHMILQGALVKMIDRTECVIFLNTPQSMVASEEMTKESRTASPWIYTEILTTKLIRKQEPKRKIEVSGRAVFESVKAAADSALPAFYHDLALQHLSPLSAPEFDTWLLSGTRGEAALNTLSLS